MEQLGLFDNFVGDAPPTEGIKYAGSKLKLLPHILQLVKKVNPKTILDGFSGTTRVSQALAKRGYRVLCNDIHPDDKDRFWDAVNDASSLVPSQSESMCQCDHCRTGPRP